MRGQLLGSSRRRWAAGALTAAIALAPLAGVAPASAAVAPNGHFTLGHGEYPDVAVAHDGTAHIAWVHESSLGVPDRIQYCRVPRGKRACVGLKTFSLPGQQIGQRPYVFLPGGSQVWIISYRCCFDSTQSPYSEQTRILRSSDGGKTFGPSQLIGSHSAEGDAQIGPHGTLFTISDVVTNGVTVQRDLLNGSGVPQVNQRAGLGTDEYGGTLAVAPGGVVLAAHYDGSFARQTFHVSRYSGTGDPNVGSSWRTVFTGKATGAPKTGGWATELTSGKRGVYLFTEDNEVFPRFQIRKWTGATFAAPTTITPAGQDNIFPTFWQDASGRLSVAYSSSARHLTYRSTSLKGFATAVTLRANDPFHLRGASAADGGGFVAYDNNGDSGGKPGTVSIVPIPVSRTLSEAVSGRSLTGKVVTFRAGQPVVLQKATGKGWVSIASKKLNSKGRFSFALPAAGVKYRAVAPATEGWAEADGKAVKR